MFLLVNLHVLGERTGVGTNGAGVELQSLVHVQMLLVGFGVSEALATYLAGESSLPCVRAHVVPQLRSLEIFLATTLTLVRLVAVVRFLVSLEVIFVGLRQFILVHFKTPSPRNCSNI